MPLVVNSLRYVYMYILHISGCDVGFHGNNCTICPDNCLNGTCQFQIGHCFDCKDGYIRDVCKEGKKLLVSPLYIVNSTSSNAILKLRL